MFVLGVSVNLLLFFAFTLFCTVLCLVLRALYVLCIVSLVFEDPTALEIRNSDKGRSAGDARAGATLLWVYGIPDDLWKYTGRGDPRKSHGDRDGPTSTDGQSGVGSDERSKFRTRSSLRKSQE